VFFRVRATPALPEGLRDAAKGLAASRGASGGGQHASLWVAAVKTTRSSDVGDVDFSIPPPQAMHLVCNRAR
jgi:hypothetical protein